MSLLHCFISAWLNKALIYFPNREMKRNKIKIVDSLTFKGLDSLTSLKMQRNGITKLMDGAFFGLNNIEEL